MGFGMQARVWGPPHPGNGSDLVSKLLERLSYEGEVNWVVSIVKELCLGIAIFQHLPRAMDVLVDGLCLPQVQDSTLAEYLQVRLCPAGTIFGCWIASVKSLICVGLPLLVPVCGLLPCKGVIGPGNAELHALDSGAGLEPGM